MKLKKDYIVLCKKSFREYISNCLYKYIFVAGKSYCITRIRVQNDGHYAHFNGENGEDYCFKYNVKFKKDVFLELDGFIDYFYTLKESRILKLNQIENELQELEKG